MPSATSGYKRLQCLIIEQQNALDLHLQDILEASETLPPPSAEAEHTTPASA